MIYSIYDGFLYTDNDGNLIPYNQKEMTEEDWEEYAKVALENKSYNGQEKGTDGTIYDPDEFIKDKYGSGYSIYKQKSLPGFEYKRQYELSIYIQKKGLSNYSEGNCSLSSIYALLNYLQSSGKYPKLPKSSETVLVDATKDKFYSKYSSKRNYEIEKDKYFPRLYVAIRNYVIHNYGYEVGGSNPFNIEKIVEAMGSLYDCNINADHILIWSYEKQVVKEIDAGYPTIWNMANSTTYQSHSTVVTGYKTYRKTRRFLGIRFYSYVELLELNDNWHDEPMCFDFTNYMAFGSFVKVR